jgi:hypothetical protein
MPKSSDISDTEDNSKFDKIPLNDTIKIGEYSKKQPVLLDNFDSSLEADVCGATNNKLEIWARVTPDIDYVKLIIYENRVVGALLIGDTGLEEVMENLILNRIDVSPYGISLLDPYIDIEDYFD